MMIRKIWKFIRLPRNLKLLLSEAIVTLFFSQVRLMLLPVDKALKVSSLQDVGDAESKLNELTAIRWALYKAGTAWFRKSRCLVQCIAGKRMLARRGMDSQIFLGVRHCDDKKIVAHAWLTAGDFEVVEKGGDYTELTKF